MVFFVFVLWMMLGVVGVRPRRDFEALEERRKKAARLFARGRSQADVARELEVSRQSASRWYAEWSTKGTGALSKAGRAGRLAKLSPAQLRRVAAELEKGPLAHGYPTDLWTLARVGEVIERTTGVSYHPGHVWKVLREQLGWSRQRPARRAVERDDEAIARWVKLEWPRVKKTPDAAMPGSASKTSRGSASYLL
jgi:transposase